MADVTLVLKAENSDLISKLTQAQKAQEKLFTGFNEEYKKKRGLIQQEQDQLEKLLRWQLKTTDPRMIAEYNKAIDAQVNKLNELNNAGREAKSKTDDLSAAVKRLGTAILAAFSVQKIWEWIKVTAIAYDQQIQAERKLLNALDGRERIQKRLLQQAKEIQKTTLFGDDDIVNAQAFLAAQGRTEEQIKKTIKAAIQLATVMGTDLMTATENLDKTYEGTLQRLGRLDGRLKGLTTEQLVNGAAVDLLGDKYKGFAETAATVGLGSVTQLKNAWGDLKETFGEVWSELLRVTGAASKMKAAMEGSVAVLQDKNIPLVKRWLAFFGIGTKGVLEQVSVDAEKAAEDLKKTEQESLDERLMAQKKFFETMFALNKEENVGKNKKLLDAYYKWIFDKIKERADVEKDAQEDWWKFEIEWGKKLFDQFKRDQKEQKDALDKQNDEDAKAAEDKEENKRRALQETYNIIIESERKIFEIMSVRNNNALNLELETLDKQTKAKLKAAGNDEKKIEKIKEESEAKKSEIEKRYKREQQKIDVKQAIIDGILSVIKTYAQFGWPAGILPAAAMAGLVALNVGAIKAQKFAKGGWTGDGVQRDETGERVAGIVHEKEFVVKKGPAHKFREVLEAINKEDRGLIVNRFNKLSPETLGLTVAAPSVNNSVSVNNNGSNSRLDQVIKEQRKLNEKFSRQRQVTVINGRTIVTERNKTRIIG